MTDQQQKALRLLGLARRARLLEIGEEPVGIVCRSGKAKLLLVAKDAGDHTFRLGTLLCFGQQMPVYLRAVHQRRAGERTGLQCLRAVRVYRSRVCKIVS